MALDHSNSGNLEQLALKRLTLPARTDQQRGLTSARHRIVDVVVTTEPAFLDAAVDAVWQSPQPVAVIVVMAGVGDASSHLRQSYVSLLSVVSLRTSISCRSPPDQTCSE